MSQAFNHLDPKELYQLTADDLVRLLHRLLHCEARHYQLSKAGILVPFQITVPDGGRDGSWNADIGQHDYIPRPATFYQCKAEHVTAPICRDEVATEKKGEKGAPSVWTVKPRVREVLSQGGCYAFFSTNHEIKPSEQTDLDKVVRDQLQAAGFQPHADAKIAFFGCNQIADWANRFPSAVRFVREITKDLGGVHYHTLESWGRQVLSEGEYFENATLKSRIAAVRDTLAEGKQRIIRLTGLSGLGKSRLIYEALKPDPHAPVAANALSASAIYLAFGDVEHEFFNFLNHLAGGGYSAVLIVDDCPPLVHDRIVQIIAPSALSVVTIFHEPQEQRQDTLPLSLEPEDLFDVVEKILRADPYLQQRGEESIKAVAAFTQGFPQIAKLMAEFRRAPSMAELADRAGLFRKLLSGGAPPDDPTLGTVQSLALFRTLGGSKQKLESDLETVRELFCPHIPALAFKRVIAEQKGRRIVQQTADTLTVAPRPLAVALTAGFIEVCPGNWKDHIASLAEAKLVSEFIRRLEELEFSDKSEEIGRLLLEEKLPFNDAEYLLSGKTGSQIFRVLSVLNPSAATKIAKRIIGEATMERLQEAKEARRNLVRALEIMVWEKTTFFDAAPLLLKLAASENETWANNASGEFGQLFALYLSGTMVPAMDRLMVIREALDAPEPSIRRTAIAALGAALHHGTFTRMSGATMGGKLDANRDWKPSTHEEINSYWRECFLLLKGLIMDAGPDAAPAKEALSKNIGALLDTRLLEELDAEFMELAAYFNGLWPEVKGLIRNTLEYRENLSASHRAALERWKGYLTPPAVALSDRLRDIVAMPGWHHRKEANGDFTDLSQADAVAFATETIANQTDLRPYLEALLTGEQQQGATFGAEIAKGHPSAHVLMEVALTLWPKLKPEQRNDSFLRGMMYGLSDAGFRDAILEKIVQDDALIELLVPLTAATSAMIKEQFLRIRRAIEADRLPPVALRTLIAGQPLRQLPDEFVRTQIEELAQAKPTTVLPLFEVLSLHCHGNPAKFDAFASTFRRLLLTPGLPIMDGHFSWEWHEAAKRLVATTNDTAWLKEITGYICTALGEHPRWFGNDYLRELSRQLVRKAPEAIWGIFAARLEGEDDLAKYTLFNFLTKADVGFDEARAEPVVWQLPLPFFRAWIAAHPQLIPRLLDQIQLFTVVQDGPNVQSYQWHPFSLELLQQGQDEETLLNELYGNLFSFGSTGSRIPYWERRLALAQTLSASDNAKLRRIGRMLADRIAVMIEHIRREEQNEQARFN